MTRAFKLGLALAVLGVSVAAAAVNAWNAPGHAAGKAVAVAVACTLVAVVHLLPALGHSRLAQPLWWACLALLAYWQAAVFGMGHMLASVVALHLVGAVLWCEALQPVPVPAQEAVGLEPFLAAANRDEELGQGPTIH